MKYILYPILFLFISCKSSVQTGEKRLTMQEYQLETANFIAQPNFSGTDMLKKVTGADARLERFLPAIEMLYFSCENDKLESAIHCLAIHKDSVYIIPADENDAAVFIGRDPGKTYFRLPITNLKIDTSRLIETPFGKATYKLTIPQIIAFANMDNTLRGGAFALTGKDKYIISHGVAQKGEPSFVNFVSQLTDKTKSREENAQALLDFVTNEIEYNLDEATSGMETIKRPDEVLFTRNSDCSGKSILYASLLQQIGVKWALLYYPGHICVGVSGNFERPGAAKVNINGTDYYIAETTTPNSRIGENTWGSNLHPDDMKFYHDPEKGDTLFNFISGIPLAFLQKTVAAE